MWRCGQYITCLSHTYQLFCHFFPIFKFDACGMPYTHSQVILPIFFTHSPVNLPISSRTHHSSSFFAHSPIIVPFIRALTSHSANFFRALTNHSAIFFVHSPIILPFFFVHSPVILPIFFVRLELLPDIPCPVGPQGVADEMYPTQIHPEGSDQGGNLGSNHPGVGRRL